MTQVIIPFREKLLKTPVAESYKKGWEKSQKVFIHLFKSEGKRKKRF